MHNLKLIIQREYLARVRHKTFVLMTFISPFVMVLMIALVAYLASLNGEEQKTVAFKDNSGLFKSDNDTNDNVSFLDYSALTVDQALDSVQANDLNGLLVVPDKNIDELANAIQFYANKSPSRSLISLMENRLSKTITERRLTNEHVDLATIKRTKTNVRIITENLSGEKTSTLAKYIKMIFGGAAGYFIMMFIIIYGNMIMRSVIEEKTNRIVEVIISSVKPVQLMLGKIAGNTLAGITQFMIWMVFGGILLTGIIFFFDIPLSSPAASGAASQVNASEIQGIVADILHLPLGRLVLAFLIYFIGGYLLYSGIYAAIGGAVDSETDTQQFIFPIIIPLMLGIYVGFFSVIENPQGTIAVLFSHIPLTSPVVMLMRIPFGVPWWEVLISISILIMTMFITIWLGAKIYRVGILMHGNKTSYKQIYRWLKRGY